MANNFENPEKFAEIAQQAAQRYPFEAPAVNFLLFQKTQHIWYSTPTRRKKYCVLRVGVRDTTLSKNTKAK